MSKSVYLNHSRYCLSASSLTRFVPFPTLQDKVNLNKGLLKVTMEVLINAETRNCAMCTNTRTQINSSIGFDGALSLNFTGNGNRVTELFGFHSLSEANINCYPNSPYSTQ